MDQAQSFVRDMISRKPGEPGQWYQMAIELKTTGEMIGDVAFQRLLEDPRQAEIGITLAAALSRVCGLKATGQTRIGMLSCAGNGKPDGLQRFEFDTVLPQSPDILKK